MDLEFIVIAPTVLLLILKIVTIRHSLSLRLPNATRVVRNTIGWPFPILLFTVTLPSFKLRLWWFKTYTTSQKTQGSTSVRPIPAYFLSGTYGTTRIDQEEGESPLLKKSHPRYAIGSCERQPEAAHYILLS